MHPQIESIFDEAENRYLNPDELKVLSQYVSSIPERLEAYRAIRDRELEIMQQVADQLVAAMPQEKVENLERSIKNALLVLRYCSMGMLLNDEQFVKHRLTDWIAQTMKAYNTIAIDKTLYQLLGQHLTQVLSPQHRNLIDPMLTLTQQILLEQEPATAASIGW